MFLVQFTREVRQLKSLSTKQLKVYWVSFWDIACNIGWKCSQYHHTLLETGYFSIGLIHRRSPFQKCFPLQHALGSIGFSSRVMKCAWSIESMCRAAVLHNSASRMWRKIWTSAMADLNGRAVLPRYSYYVTHSI